MLVVILSLFSWFPHMTVYVLRTKFRKLIQMDDFSLLNIRVAVWYFSYVNSALNPFVYALRYILSGFFTVQSIIHNAWLIKFTKPSFPQAPQVPDGLQGGVQQVPHPLPSAQPHPGVHVPKRRWSRCWQGSLLGGGSGRWHGNQCQLHLKHGFLLQEDEEHRTGACTMHHDVNTGSHLRGKQLAVCLTHFVCLCVDEHETYSLPLINVWLVFKLQCTLFVSSRYKFRILCMCQCV